MQDGNITCNVGNVSTKAQDRRHRSVLSAASYQSGEVLYSQKKKRDVDAREAGDGDVLFTEIIAPDGAPEWVFDRGELWNNAEANPPRKDARLGKKIMVAFTRDVPDNMRLDLLRDYVQQFVDMGCVADVAVHNDPQDHNPHVHILLSTYRLKADGFEGKGGKIEQLDRRKFVNSVRKSWADLTNQYLKKAGSSLRVDHRSYKARGIELEPTKHRGPDYDPYLLHEREDAQQVLAKPLEQVVQQSSEKQKEKTPERTEDVMSKPTLEELKNYPHLIHREEWPPAREAAPDMTRQERDEHRRYWQESDNAENELLAHDFNGEHMQDALEAEKEHRAERLAQQDEEQYGEYAHAINKAKQEAGWISNEQREYVEDMLMDQEVRQIRQQEQSDLYMRAVDMKPTREEIELRDMAKAMTPKRRQAVHSFIISKRMERLQALDNEKLRASLEKDMQASEKLLLRQLERASYEHDSDRYPEQGPDGSPVRPSELEQGINNMIAEMEREGDLIKPDHDENEWQRMGRARDELMDEFEKEEERERER